MGWKPSHGRMKPKYNPQPNAEEKRHEDRIRQLPCIGCGGHCTELHHLMQPCEGKRWRRDHRFQLPLCSACHRGATGIHGMGSEAGWAEAVGVDVVAIAPRLWMESIT